MPLSPGENIGPYRIIEQLGQGGMATVFKAYHPALDRYVAIKVLHPAFKEDPNFLARFQREARIVAKLEHPHIVPVYDFSEHKGMAYLVMRYVEGETLKAHLTGEPLSPQRILEILKPVAEALAYAHEQGVLHRDIKPSNVMLTPEDSIFLTDFGLARMAQSGESTLSQDMMIGTPQYMSPEQAKGEEVDERTDIYSLGVVLFEMLTGRVPFSADTPYAIIHDHIYTPLPLPTAIKPDIFPALERVVLKALAKEKDDRYQKVTELAMAFEDAVIETASRPNPHESAG
jgi:serine/threonine protein kinase